MSSIAPKDSQAKVTPVQARFKMAVPASAWSRTDTTSANEIVYLESSTKSSAQVPTNGTFIFSPVKSNRTLVHRPSTPIPGTAVRVIPSSTTLSCLAKVTTDQKKVQFFSKEASLASAKGSDDSALWSIDEVPFTKVLSYCSVEDLLKNLSKVCLRISHLTKTELANKRRHLTILLGPDAEALLVNALSEFEKPPLNHVNTLRFNTTFLTDEETQGLIVKMPQISSLTVSFSRLDNDEIDQVRSLLRIWDDQLTELVLIFDSGEEELNALLNFEMSISDLRNLHHLTMYCKDNVDLGEDIHRRDLNLPLLSQMITMHCVLGGSLQVIFARCLTYLDDSDLLRVLSFGDNLILNGQIDQLMTLQKLPGLLTKLNIEYLSNDQLPRFTRNFSNLVSLSISLERLEGGTLPIALLATHLNEIPSLTHLTLNQMSIEVQLQAIRAQPEQHPPADNRLLPSIPTVTHLHCCLWGSVGNHEELANLNLNLILPNLKEILFDIDDFEPCQACSQKWVDEAVQKENCAREMLLPIVSLFNHLQIARLGIDLELETALYINVFPFE